MKKKKKISVQTIIEVMIRAVFFIIYPALFSTAFTGIKLIVEQITQRANPQKNRPNTMVKTSNTTSVCTKEFHCRLARCVICSTINFIPGRKLVR